MIVKTALKCKTEHMLFYMVKLNIWLEEPNLPHF